MSLGGRRWQITGGGYRAEVAEVGANLAGLWHDDGTDGGFVPVTVDNPPDELPPKSSGAVLLPWPNRIAGGRYRFDGVDYQLPLSEPAKGNATHGLVRWARWSVAEQDDSSLTLVHDL